MASYKTPVLVSVPGIRTHGQWQKLLAVIAGNFAIPTRPFDYGYFNIFQFLHKPSRKKIVAKFYDYYSTVVSDRNLAIDPDNFLSRPSIVAHSFGTYIVANCMLKHREMKFNKIIL